MLDTISKRHSRKRSDIHPHDWILREQSSKSKRFRSSNDLPVVPSPSVFCDVAIPYSLIRNNNAPPTFEQYPAPGHVASHLLLIECFQHLRFEVESSEQLTAAFKSQYPSGQFGSSITSERLWTCYLTLAITRFKLWITKIESILRHSAIFNRYGTGSHLHGAFTENYLPPIDVLLIWYCYLQTPTAYERLLASNDFTLLSQICFPWHLFPGCIDQNTLEYRFSKAAQTLWRKMVGLPIDLEDCIGEDLANDNTAFTSHDSEILDLALRQTALVEDFCEYHWLRSPSLLHTIQRALSQYANVMVVGQLPNTPRTQQVPVITHEPMRTTDELDLNLPAQLILNTHRAFHSAWQAFAQLYNIQTDERPPPPSYDEAKKQPLTPVSSNEKDQIDDISSSKYDPMKQKPDLNSCYCWVCERIKDDVSGLTIPDIPSMAPLSPVSSPEDVEPHDDEKRHIGITSESLSDGGIDSRTPSFKLDLTRKQIKAIITEVSLYRRVEDIRQNKSKGYVASTEAG